MLRSLGAADVMESDLRQTAINEYFASGHKAAVIGGEEQGNAGRFVRIAHTFKWCLTRLNWQEELPAFPSSPAH